MIKNLSFLLVSLFWCAVGWSQVSLTGSNYSEDFSTLVSTGTSSSTPVGWSFLETGSNANALYTAGTGSSNSGDTYSFGTLGSTDRAFGFLRSGSLTSTIGASFTNNTGVALTSISIAYRGEHWRLGFAGRADRLDFQYSTNATSLSTGTWTDVNALDFNTPTPTGTVGAIDGNSNFAYVSATISSLNIPNGATFFIRFLDFDATNADDGLAVDDFTLSTGGVPLPTLTVAAGTSPAESPTTNGSFVITASTAPTADLVVNYAVTGTATSGTDYTALSGTATILANNTSVTISVPIIDDAAYDPSETVILTLGTAPSGYANGTPASATLTIADNEIPPPSTISAVQGSGNAATAGGTTVTAIVTGVYPTLSPAGFYLQEEDADADGDAATSEGIFVVSGATVAVGDRVTVSGTVQENASAPSFNQAVITSAMVNIVSSGNALPTPTDITLPFASTTFAERFEGMRIRITTALTAINTDDLARRGEVFLASGGITYQPTQLIDPNDVPASGTSSTGASNAAAITAAQVENALRTIVLDDGSSVAPSAIPYLNADNTLRVGSTITTLQGIMGFGFSRYRIQPEVAQPPAFAYNPRPAVPDVLMGTGNLKIASFNVLNYFNGDGAGGGFPTLRGANSPAEFARQRAKIINALVQMDADVIGAIELENDGIGSASAIQDLVNGLNAATAAGTYAFINDDLNGDNKQDNNTDEIRSGIIYKPAKVTPTGAAMLSVSGTFDRPPLAQTFTHTASTRRFNFIVNHFKSKGGCPNTGINTDQGDGQSCWNDRRRMQSTELVNFISNTVAPTSGTADVVSVGDYNAYFEEDPMDILRANGYNVLGSGSDYSFNFSGILGSLDHAVVNSTLNASVTGFAKWKINSAEPTFLGYEDNVLDASETASDLNPAASLYTVSPWASSDHDPVLIGLRLDAPVVTPVRLVGFTAVARAGVAELNWSTSLEVNVARFRIERSADNRNWTSPGTVAAAGTSATLQQYRFTDALALSGTNFYRLKIEDIDGKFEYSPTARVVFGGNVFSLSPNPATGFTAITTGLGGVAELVSSTGAVVKKFALQAGTGRVSLVGIVPGSYVLRLRTEKGLWIEKLVIR